MGRKEVRPDYDYNLDDLGIDQLDGDFDDELIELPEEQARFLDVHAIVLDNELTGRRFFNADNEQKQLDALLPGLPGEHECYKIIGGRRGFSCIGLIEYIAKREPIHEMWMTTFRCETKQMIELDRMHAEGLVGYICMIVSRTDGILGGRKTTQKLRFLRRMKITMFSKQAQT